MRRTVWVCAVAMLATAALGSACGTVSPSQTTASACSRASASAAIGKTAPAPRDFPAIAYDATTCEVVLFGGSGQTDTWTWDATGWTEQHPQHVPAATQIEVAAYDPITKHVLLVETPTPGVNGGVTTWSWSGGDWHQITTAHQPMASMASVYASLVLNPTAGKLLLISNSPQSWAWDGADWSPDPTPAAPMADVVFDRELGTLVAVDLGGEANGPIVSKLVPGANGASPAWVRYDATSTTWPDYPIGYSLYHDAIGKVVYFMPARDSSARNQTWAWSDGTWTLWPPGTEPKSFWRSHGVYDAALQAIVFFGGGASASAAGNETWVLTASGWTQVG